MYLMSFLDRSFIYETNNSETKDEPFPIGTGFSQKIGPWSLGFSRELCQNYYIFLETKRPLIRSVCLGFRAKTVQKVEQTYPCEL